MSNFAYLLDREPVDVRPDGDYLTGRTVLVTGAGGSIGSRIAREVDRHHPERIILLGHGESTLLATQRQLASQAVVALADVRDGDRILDVFDDFQPYVVFHAAALKHVDLLEQAPGEAVRTNVHGTMNVLAAAASTGVGRLVNISTDKACDPTAALGASKRITERLTAWYAPLEYTSVRFGNVLGSRGSVAITFAHQVAAGGPLTVTHPDIDRYFMTVEEAVALVVHVGSLAHAGDVHVLELGAPLRIVELARRISRLATGSEMDVLFTGLRPGDKLHEELIAATEERLPSEHPLIARVVVPALDPAGLDRAVLDPCANPEQLRAQLAGCARAVSEATLV